MHTFLTLYANTKNEILNPKVILKDHTQNTVIYPLEIANFQKLKHLYQKGLISYVLTVNRTHVHIRYVCSLDLMTMMMGQL